MNLEEQRAATLKAAQEIVDGAKSAGRDMTSEEVADVNKKFAEIDDLDAKIKAADESQRIASRIGDLAGAKGVKELGEDVATSLGEHFAKSVGAQGFASFKAGDRRTVAAPEFKAATDAQSTPGVFSPVLTQVDTNIVRGFRRPTVSNLLGTGTLTGNAVTYFVENPLIDGGFATVPELGLKPQMHFNAPTAVTDSLKKIAAWWDTSDEMIEDVAFWVSEINNRGLYELSLFEEQQLLNGDGKGSNLNGMLNRSGVQTETVAASGDAPQDAILRAATKVQTATGLTADALIINPLDYQNLRLNKDGNGQYFGGGYFQGEYGNGGILATPNVWGLNTVVSVAVPKGTAVVGALKQATTVYRKGGVRVESTNSDEGKFKTNVVTTRIEERIALAVRVPSAIVKVTLGAVA